MAQPYNYLSLFIRATSLCHSCRASSCSPTSRRKLHHHHLMLSCVLGRRFALRRIQLEEGSHLRQGSGST